MTGKPNQTNKLGVFIPSAPVSFHFLKKKENKKQAIY